MTQAPASSPPPQIVARDLTKTYRMGDSVIGALQGINVEVARGEYLAVTGHSGSGKSTFMNLIGALDTPTSGSLKIEDRELSGLSSMPSRNTATRRSASYSRPSICSRGRARSTTWRSRSSIRTAPARAMRGRRRERAWQESDLPSGSGISHLSFPAASSSAWPSPARWSTTRNILLADEPTGALDSRTTDEIIALFEALNESGITVILVTHERDIAARARRRITFRDGLMVEDTK